MMMWLDVVLLAVAVIIELHRSVPEYPWREGDSW